MVNDGERSNNFANPQQMMYNFQKTKTFEDDIARYDKQFNNSDMHRNSHFSMVNGVRPNTIGPLQSNNNTLFSNGNLMQTTPNNENSLLSGQNRVSGSLFRNGSIQNQIQSPTHLTMSSPEMILNNRLPPNNRPNQMSHFNSQSQHPMNDHFPSQQQQPRSNGVISSLQQDNSIQLQQQQNQAANASYQDEYPPLKGLNHPPGVISGPSTNSAIKSSYVMKQENTEFTMQSEDFPALPATSSNTNQVSNHMNSVFPDQDGRGDESNHKSNPLGVQIGVQGIEKSKRLPSTSSNNQSRGIQITANDTVQNIPSSMLRDQYGMVGLLAFIKTAEQKPSLTHLALGTDLTTLGLNLNSQSNLHPRYRSPFSRQMCRLQDLDCFVPAEYKTNAQLREKLAPIKLTKYGDDLLFFVFYSYPGDIMQFAAAVELYNRDWRFHKDQGLWITRAPGTEARSKSEVKEEGKYIFFDYKTWTKITKDFILEYSMLEQRPVLPNMTALHYNPNQHG